MNKPGNFDFIVIDDDYVNNLICSSVIQAVCPGARIDTFQEPEDGLAYIRSLVKEPATGEIILLLDINMPSLTGWDVLEQFEMLPVALKARFRIYILSSSIAAEDKLKANEWAIVHDFIEKPLTIEGMNKILQQ